MVSLGAAEVGVLQQTGAQFTALLSCCFTAESVLGGVALLAGGSLDEDRKTGISL